VRLTPTNIKGESFPVIEDYVLKVTAPVCSTILCYFRFYPIHFSVIYLFCLLSSGKSFPKKLLDT
jgi:hypothetical protein